MVVYAYKREYTNYNLSNIDKFVYKYGFRYTNRVFDIQIECSIYKFGFRFTKNGIGEN